MKMITVLRYGSVSVSMLSWGEAAVGVRSSPRAAMTMSIVISGVQTDSLSPAEIFDPM
jgi:hypothetical protein